MISCCHRIGWDFLQWPLLSNDITHPLDLSGNEMGYLAFSDKGNKEEVTHASRVHCNKKFNCSWESLRVKFKAKVCQLLGKTLSTGRWNLSSDGKPDINGC